MQLVSLLLRGSERQGHTTSSDARVEKMIGERLLVLNLLTGMISRGGETDTLLLEHPVRVDDRLELLQLQFSHHHGRAIEEEDAYGSSHNNDDADEDDSWQVRLLFNLDPLGAFGAWLQWDGHQLAVDCWIESVAAWRVGNTLLDDLNQRLAGLGIERLALHRGTMPQPDLPGGDGGNLSVTV